MINYIVNIFLLLILSVTSLSAQFQLNGSVLDEEKESIEFANIVLLDGADSTYINGQITDNSGQFIWNDLAKGKYIITISFLGYETKSIPIELDKDLTLQPITLFEEELMLNTATVSERRKLISRKIDRLVFDVENSSKSDQGDALDLLRVTPGIQVRNESINIIGKNGVALMINDKLIRLSDEELAAFLRTIASEDISKIEVITAPPAKYEAEGNSGLINIQLKTAKKDSWNLSLKGDYRQRTNPRYSLGMGLQYNKNKLSLSSSIFYQRGIYRQHEEVTAYFPEGIWFTNSSFNRAFDEYSGRLNLTYTISPKWTIGSQYIFSRSIQNTTDSPYSFVHHPETQTLLQSLNSKGLIKQKRNIHSVNFYNQFKLDSMGKLLTINLDYFNFDDFENKEYRGTSIIESPLHQQYFAGSNSNNQLITNASFAIDFKLPTKIVNMEFGGKLTKSISSNDIQIFNSGLVDDPIIDFPLMENNFEYVENIRAIYGSFHKKINSKWAMILGLRMESTQTLSKTNNLDSLSTKKYIKLFPSFFLEYAINEQTTLHFNYNKRISRAPFYMLTPNPWIANPFQSVVGNPFLQPSFTDNYELNLTYKNLTTSIYYTNQKNIFTQVPIPNLIDNSMVFKFENFLDTKKTGINANYLFEHFKWWSSSNSFDFNYSINKFINENAITTKKGYNTNLSTSNDFYFNTKQKLSLNLSYWYSPPQVDEIWNIKSMSNLSASLQLFLLNKKLKLTLRANDIFKTQKDRIQTTVDGVFQNLMLYYDARYLGFSISYIFGGSNISSQKNKVGNQEERNRAGF